MNNHNAKLSLPIAIVMASGVMVSPVFASDNVALEEIIVTAQRRAESLSDTPISVSAIPAGQLEKANITSEQDLRTVVPGLSIRAGLNSNNLNYAIRGQSQDPYAATRPGVMPYVNEVQVGAANSAAASAFYDLESIQVLKGPQGTLFGRSATGGAVLLTTRKPSDEVEGYISALAGNYAMAKFEGAISGPLTDGLKGRLAGFYEERDGYQDNLYNDTELGEYERFGLRGSFTFETDNLTNDLVVDYYEYDGENTTGTVYGLMPLNPTPPPFLPIELIFSGAETPGQIAVGAGTLSALTGGLVDFESAAAWYKAYYTGREEMSLNYLVEQNNANPYDIYADGPMFNEAKNILISNATSFEINENLTLRNIIGYIDTDNTNATDADGTPFLISQSTVTLGPGISQKTEQLSEELQLQGTAMNERLDFTTGLYWSDETLTHHQSSVFFEILNFGAPLVPLINNFDLTNETQAVYAQGTYQLNDTGLAFTLGGRYTHEKAGKEILALDSFAGVEGSPLFNLDKEETFNTFSWQVGLENRFSPDLLGYVVSRRAYKAGGFNGTAPPVAQDGVDSFKEEKVTDIELGFKYNGVVGDTPVRANIATFYSEQEDAQRAGFTMVLANPVGLTVNVPKAEIWGIELDGVVQATDWLSVGAMLSYLDAKYKSDPVAIPFGLTPNPLDIVITEQVYDQVTDTPELSGSIYADVTMAVADGVDALFHADYYFQDATTVSPRSVNNVGTGIDSYEILNLRAGLEFDSGLSITANVKNVTDEEYFVGGLPSGEIYQINILTIGAPRTFTVEARYNF